MARLRDLISAKDELSSRLLGAWSSRRPIVAAPEQSAVAARRKAGRNVHAIGVGRKIVSGKPTGMLCVRIYVVEKRAESVIARKDRVPAKIAGLPTDVIESPPAFAHQSTCSTDRTLRQRPIVGGISAAHRLVNRTTLGCFCRSTRRGESNLVFMLSNNHAFANLNAGARGDPILQPSAGDGGGLSADGDIAGVLTRFVPVQFGRNRRNLVDAAIAQVAQGTAVTNEICMIGPLSGIAQAGEGMIVRKHGRTTGYTEGEIVDISLDVVIPNYGGRGDAKFVNQFRTNPGLGFDAFVRPGDSGSVLVDKHAMLAVGLHFAGGADGYSVANPIGDVCRLLEITIP